MPILLADPLHPQKPDLMGNAGQGARRNHPYPKARACGESPVDVRVRRYAFPVSSRYSLNTREATIIDSRMIGTPI